MLRDILVLSVVGFSGLIYYLFAMSKSAEMRNLAFYMKMCMLAISFILAFMRQDYLLIGNMAFGGRTSVSILILIEIVDAIIDKKEKAFKHRSMKKKRKQ